MTPPNAKLLTCREVERMYRLRHGTAGTAFHMRMIPGRQRGKAIYVSAKRAQELWGVQ